MGAGALPFTVTATPTLEAWFHDLDTDVKKAITVRIRLLETLGPSLGRPYVDTLAGSRLRHHKELRVQHRGRPYRILFAFAPDRSAVLLIGGDKTDSRRWYERAIARAEIAYDAYVAQLVAGHG